MPCWGLGDEECVIPCRVPVLVHGHALEEARRKLKGEKKRRKELY
jgi:hypothetical protein